MNIVAVDDSAVLREYISMLLECDGHTVYPAESAATAVETIATTAIDLVLSDVHMEGMTCHRSFIQQLLESPAFVCPVGQPVAANFSA